MESSNCNLGRKDGKITNLACYSASLYIHSLEVLFVRYPEGSTAAPGTM